MLFSKNIVSFYHLISRIIDVFVDKDIYFGNNRKNNSNRVLKKKSCTTIKATTTDLDV